MENSQTNKETESKTSLNESNGNDAMNVCPHGFFTHGDSITNI